jgi:hypothetical protein
MGPSVLV